MIDKDKLVGSDWGKLFILLIAAILLVVISLVVVFLPVIAYLLGWVGIEIATLWTIYWVGGMRAARSG